MKKYFIHPLEEPSFQNSIKYSRISQSRPLEIEYESLWFVLEPNSQLDHFSGIIN